MTGVNLAISGEALIELERFSWDFGKLPLRSSNDGYRISIEMKNFSVSFSQIDRYESDVSCSFDFEGNRSFSYEIASAAISNSKNFSINEPIYFDVSVSKTKEAASALAKNNIYVSRVIEFLRDNINEIQAFPPKWYKVACLIEREVMSKKVSDIAEYEFSNKMLLWSLWAEPGIKGDGG